MQKEKTKIVFLSILNVLVSRKHLKSARPFCTDLQNDLQFQNNDAHQVKQILTSLNSIIEIRDQFVKFVKN